MCRITAIFGGGPFQLGAIIIIAYHCVSALKDCVVGAHLIPMLIRMNENDISGQIVNSLEMSISMYLLNFCFQFICLILLTIYIIQLRVTLLLIWQILMTLNIICKIIFFISFTTIFSHKWIFAKLPFTLFELFLTIVVFLYYRQHYCNILSRIRLNDQMDQALENK